MLVLAFPTMKTKQPPRLALALPPPVLRAVEKYAKDTRRSRPKALLHLIEIGLEVAKALPR